MPPGVFVDQCAADFHGFFKQLKAEQIVEEQFLKDVDFVAMQLEDWYDVVNDLDDNLPHSVQQAMLETSRISLLTSERDRSAALCTAAEQALADGQRRWMAAEEELRGLISQLTRERDDCDARFHTCQHTLSEAQRRLKGMTEDWEQRCHALEAERDECAGKQRSAERVLADLKRKLRATEEEWEAQTAALTSDRDEYEAKLRSVRRSLAEAQRQWKATEEELEGHITHLEEERDDWRAKHRAVERSLSEMQRQWQRTEEEMRAQLVSSLTANGPAASSHPAVGEEDVRARLTAITRERDELATAQQRTVALVAELEKKLAMVKKEQQGDCGSSQAREHNEAVKGQRAAQEDLEAAEQRWLVREKELEVHIATLTQERDYYAAGQQEALKVLAETQQKLRAAEVRRFTVIERRARSGSGSGSVQGESVCSADLTDPIAASVVVISCAPCVERDLTMTGDALRTALAQDVPCTFLTAFLETVHRVPSLSQRQLLAGLASQPRPPHFATSSWVDLNDPFQVVRHTGGRTKCLIVALQYRGQHGELQDSVPEARNVKRWLFFQGFSTDPEYLRVLADDGNYGRAPPTKANILDGLQWLAAGAQPGDNLFFLYAGHGAQVRRPSSRGGDRVVPGLLPLDFEAEGAITDKMLFRLLILRLPPTVHLTILMDCFHTGPAVEMPYCFQADASNDSLVLNPNFSPDSFAM